MKTKKIKWLIQDVNMRFDALEETYQALSRLDYPMEAFGVIPFTKEITNLENILEEDCYYIFRSGTKVLNMLEGVLSIEEVNDFLTPEQIKNSKEYIRRLKMALFYDIEKFDQAYYANFDLPLLNAEADYYPIRNNLNLSFSEDKFIKPSKDLKSFVGGILDKGMNIEEFIKNQYHQSFYIEEDAVIAPLKKIYAEYRFFVVEKEVITGSLYKRGDKVMADANIPEEIVKVAKDYAKLYQPHDIFTMDIADTPEGYKIVEYNCWNASGTYHCDLLKIYNRVNDYAIANFK